MTFASDEIGKPPEGAIRTFAHLVQTLEDGGLHTDLTQAMESLIREINDLALTGRKAKGSINLTISLEADRGAVEPSGSFTVKTPKRVRLRSAFLYIANGGFLTPRDPKQMSMSIRSVDGQRPEIRVIGD